MALRTDLSPCVDLFGEAGDAALAVGWLERDCAYPTGAISPEVFARLQSLCREPWQPSIACGTYECDLCQFEGTHGSANVFVPGDGVIYVCPELIVHYIAAHWHQPPDEFCAAVLRCPDQNTMEFKRLLLQNGGRRLVRPMDGPAGL